MLYIVHLYSALCARDTESTVPFYRIESFRGERVSISGTREEPHDGGGHCSD